jgi:protein-export membrane protein SecD
MLHLAPWKAALILLVVAIGVIATVPNFFSRETIEAWPSWMPRKQVVLGLDLQGGAYLLYQVDQQAYVESRLRATVSDVRRRLLEAPRIGYTGLGVQGQAVQFRLRDPADLNTTIERVTPLRNQLNTSFVGGAGVFEFDLDTTPDGLVRLVYTDAGLAQRMRSIVQQSIEVINRRVDQLGTVEPSITRQGEDRILVEAPGLGDPQRLKDLVGQTAQLTFHLVRRSVPTSDAATAREPGTIVLPSEEDPQISYLVDESPLMTGEDLTDAQAAFDRQSNEPVVNFRLSTGGAVKFGQVTQQNVGRPFAIVLDNQVISAPTIREPILGGSGQISGSFNVQQANDLAILLRAGALPAKLTIVEERTIGPSLGADSIRAGIIASIVALVAIVAVMVICYGILGVFADIALVANNFLMIGILSLLGATLTLPGIAGIVLTMGMAVDANVLIYERMREEAHAGRSTIVAFDQGFRKAFATIIDSHLTALIAAIALFWLGAGPIRGFAVTLAIGIICTLFTSYLVTRLIVTLWIHTARPKTVPL